MEQMEQVRSQALGLLEKGKGEAEKKLKEVAGSGQLLDLGVRSVNALADALSGKSKAEYERAVSKIREQETTIKQQSLAEQARATADRKRREEAIARTEVEFRKKRPLYEKYGWDTENVSAYRSKQLQTFGEKKALVKKIAQETGLYDERELMRKDLPELKELEAKIRNFGKTRQA